MTETNKEPQEDQQETTLEDVESISHYLSGMYPGSDYDDLFQVAYLEGLEALMSGANVFNRMKKKVAHVVATQESPVEVPRSGHNDLALAKVRKGLPPESASERRIASVLGKREDVLPITLVTHDHPESLYMHKESLEALRAFLDHDRFYLTEQQRDAIGVVFFGKPVPEEYYSKYGVGRDSLNWHKKQALIKLKKALD